MTRLRHDYPVVKDGQQMCCGGNQAWFERKAVQNMGCGFVSAFDLLWYAALHRRDSAKCYSDLVPGERAYREEYTDKADRIRRSHFPVIPGIGVPGPVLARGLNRCFRRMRLPLQAVWKVSRRGLWNRIDEMLEQDIPVILAIGPNLPFFWRKGSVIFYKRTEREYRPARWISGHYVTVIGMEKEWMQILSWGKEFWIRREDYEAHWKCSAPLFHNMIYIRER